MDLVTVDVTDIGGVAVGDEVVLLGEAKPEVRPVPPLDTVGDDAADLEPKDAASGAAGRARITAEELAAKLGTISYEVFCSVGARVPRVYLDGAEIVSIRSRFA